MPDLPGVDDATIIRETADILCPDLRALIWHDSPITASTWNAGLETGKAVELLSFFALIAALRDTGASVSIPELYTSNPDLFYLRNIIPRHHGAQAGHAVAFETALPLSDRFQAAFTPKANITTSDGRSLLIYREGHPPHLMAHLHKYGTEYHDRPDFLITEGEFQMEFDSPTSLAFAYSAAMGKLSGTVRIKNDSRLPLKSLQMPEAYHIPAAGIIECSIGKGSVKAADQIARYQSIFGGTHLPKSLLVNGQRKTCSAVDHEIMVDLTPEGIKSLSLQLAGEMRRFAESLCAWPRSPSLTSS